MSMTCLHRLVRQRLRHGRYGRTTQRSGVVVARSRFLDCSDDPADDCWSTWTDVTWGMGRFVAVGAAPGCRVPYTSIDGKTWLSGPVAADLPGMFAVTVGPASTWRSAIPTGAVDQRSELDPEGHRTAAMA